MIINFPTILSLFRVFIIPLLIVVFYAPVWWSATVCVLIFILAAVTDVLDGYLARRSDQVTRFGTFIDPIADKLIVSVTLILIAEREDFVDCHLADLGYCCPRDHNIRTQRMDGRFGTCRFRCCVMVWKSKNSDADDSNYLLVVEDTDCRVSRS